MKRWGRNIKQGTSRFGTLAKASAGYVDVSANLLRAPIEPTNQNSDDSVDVSLYQADITAIKTTLAVNPEVEVFASVKLHGENTFPEWLGAATPDWPEQRRSNFSNPVLMPSPERYAALVSGYVDMLYDEGIRIDYLGLNNGTVNAVPANRYVATFDNSATSLTRKACNRLFDNCV